MSILINKLTAVLIVLASTSILNSAQAQQGQTSYKYGCTITSPPDMVARWVSQRGSPNTVIMFNVPTNTVYFLGGMANFRVDPNGLVSWTYENLFTHARSAASFDNRTHELTLENAEWHCSYEGPGP